MTQRVVNYTYGTGNPVLPDGSIDVRDGIDNLQSMDVFMNAPEDTYNQRDGEVVRTVAGMNNEFDAQILNMGFTRVGTFAAGATITNTRQTLLWDIADGGDGQEYGWSGAFPKVAPAASTPASTGGISVGAWISRFDPELRIQVREALRRSYAEAGYSLVDGSFEAGGVLVNANDVLLHEVSGKAFSGPAGVVPAGTDPASGGFVDRSGEPQSSGKLSFTHSESWKYLPASVGYRLANAVYVTDAPFNVVPNVTVDQTAKIQQAIDYSMSFAKPKLLVVPHGTFTVNGALSWPAGKTPRVMGLGESSVIRRSVGSSSYIFTFNDNFYLHDLFFAGAVDGGVSKAVKANAGNTAKLERNYFQLQDVGIELSSSFAVELTSNVFDVCKVYGVVSTTACHNLVIRNNNFFTCGVGGGGHAISLQAPTDNIIIDGNDFEYCNVNVRLNAATAVRITGNYMECHKAACFDFVGTQYGVEINHNWIALGDDTSGGNTQTLGGIVGGEFAGNTVYNQTIDFANTLVGFDVGVNTKTGTGTIGKTPFISPTLLNSWSQQAGYSKVGYRKDNTGHVHIKGAVIGGSGQNIIFTLPAEYRPTDGVKVFACASANGPCTIYVGTNGNVVALTSTANNPGFDGIYFYVG